MRASCAGCRRPLAAGACFCDRLTLLPTRTRILLLQHPRERRMAIGTARLAHLALPRSELRVGVDFSEDPSVQELGADAYVLFPSPEASPLDTLPRDRPLTLVVLDGTWSQARKLLKLNPALARLPRVSFRPRAPSAYLIRRQPAAFCLSTIEALAEVLEALEPESGPFSRLLAPFHGMVARQRWFETEVHAHRHRHPARKRPSRRDALAARLEDAWPRLLCVQGEANAWPLRHPERADPETVHWVAHRPATGETFEAVIAPRRVLAPATPTHIELDAERLRGGITAAAWHAAWHAFLRPDDLIVTWGRYYRDLATTDGLALPPALDLRAEVSQALRRRVGTLEEATTALGATPAALGITGRGGRRLAAMTGILKSLRDPAVIVESGRVSTNQHRCAP
jgi:DTW domain-containing protein